MTEEDEWYEPVPWTWRGNTAAAVSILTVACVLHFVVYPRIPKPPTNFMVQQFNIAAKDKPPQYCSIAGLYYDGRVWRCA